MSSSISRLRGRVAVVAAALLIFLPVNSSIAKADVPDTTLSVFTVNGQDATSGVVNLPVTVVGTDATVVATPTDTALSQVNDVTISGGTSLHVGHNPLSVTVTNLDQTSKYDVDVNVLTTPNTLLKTLTINAWCFVY